MKKGLKIVFVFELFAGGHGEQQGKAGPCLGSGFQQDFRFRAEKGVDAFGYVGQADASAMGLGGTAQNVAHPLRRSRVHAPAVVGDGHGQPSVFHGVGSHQHHAAPAAVDAVDNGVFHKGLENHFAERPVGHAVVNAYVIAHPLA